MYEFVLGCLAGCLAGALTVASVRILFPMPQPSETWMRAVKRNDERIAEIEWKIRRAEADETTDYLTSSIMARQSSPESERRMGIITGTGCEPPPLRFVSSSGPGECERKPDR